MDKAEITNHIFSNHTVSATGDGVVVQSAEDILIGIQDQQERQELVACSCWERF